MTDTIYLDIDGSTSVGVPTADALAMDRKGFIKLYRGTVYGSTRKEAGEWADRQILQRENARARGSLVRA